ncbi:MAG: type II toxin-antitoxin system HicB family antitoxin [bacterium]
MYKFPIIVEKETDGGYSAWCPVLPGCASQGNTEEEAKKNIKEAIELYLEVDELSLLTGKNQKLYKVAI